MPKDDPDPVAYLSTSYIEAQSQEEPGYPTMRPERYI
jgi:hypothetical protein